MSALILRPSNFSELATFAQMAAKSSMVPQAYRGKAEDIMLAVQLGSELGLAPMQAIQNVAVIQGRPSVWGDALIGLCRASSVCEDIAEKIEGDGDNAVAICTAKRRNSTPVTVRFSVADAKRAGLWGKVGPWQQYPLRMLQMRARGFALRDAFPDLLKGIITAEEAQDIPTEKRDTFTGPTLEATAVVVETPPQPQQPKSRTLTDIIATFDAVKNAQDYYTALDNDGQRITWLKDNRPEAYERVEAARKAAAARMEEMPPPPPIERE